MDKSVFDLAVDLVKERLADARAVIHERYKGVRKFRVDPPPERQRLYEYLKMTPEDKEFGRQSFGDVYSVYEAQMQALKEKYNVQ